MVLVLALVVMDLVVLLPASGAQKDAERWLASQPQRPRGTARLMAQLLRLLQQLHVLQVCWRTSRSTGLFH